MKKKFSNFLIPILALSYLLIISIIIINSKFNTNVVKDITLITTSFSTLIIALLLYDRFNFRKIIFERKLDIVLKLLEHLKSTRVQINYRNFENELVFFGTVSVDRAEINKLLSSNHFNYKSNVIFEAMKYAII